MQRKLHLSVTDTRTDLISRPHESRSGSMRVSLAQGFGENRAVRPLLALIFVTAVWGVTFVQVKDAVAIYPLFAFLAVRFAIATGTLALPAAKRVRGLGRSGVAGGAFLGLLLAAGYALQTAGLERTTVSSTGFITGMYVVLTPLIALVLYRARIGLAAWGGVLLATAGLAMLSGITRARRREICSCSLQRRCTRSRSS